MHTTPEQNKSNCPICNNENYVIEKTINYVKNHIELLFSCNNCLHYYTKYVPIPIEFEE